MVRDSRCDTRPENPGLTLMGMKQVLMETIAGRRSGVRLVCTQFSPGLVENEQDKAGRDYFAKP